MNYFTLTKKLCSIILTLVMVFNPAFVSAQTASDYLAKAGENLSLAGITLANEIRDSIITTAESIREETVNLAVKTKDAIVAGADTVKQSVVTLTVNTRDAIVAGAEAVKTGVITYATNTRDGAIELKNISVEAGTSLVLGLTHTGDSILAYVTAMSTLAAATPEQANQQTSSLGPHM